LKSVRSSNTFKNIQKC